MPDNHPQDENASSPSPNEEPQMRLASAHNMPPNAAGEADEATFSDNREETGEARDLLES